MKTKGFRISRWAIGVFLVSVWGMPIRVSAATICVTPAAPSGGCTSTQAGLQAALNAAAGGDTISLAAGSTHTGSFTLPNKGVTSFITITTDAPTGSLPAAGVRTGPAYASFMPKIVSSGGGAPAIQTADGANHYRFRHIWFPAVPFGFSTMVVLGNGDNLQQFESQEPSYIVIDQCYFVGDPVAGQKRAVAVNGKNLTITNSYFTQITAVGEDSQCIAGWNGHGPLDVENNYLECGTENFIIGGVDPWVRTYVAISSSPTTTSANVTILESGHTLSEFAVGQVIAIRPTATGTVEYATIATVTGTGTTGSLTWTPATSVTPDTTGLIRGGAVLKGLTFRHNHVTKNPAWMTGVMAAPTMTSATAAAGGTLTGTYYYKAQAFSANGYGQSFVNGPVASSEVFATAAGQKITVVFSSVTGATVYRLFRGTASGAQSEWTDCASTTCVDDGTRAWTAAAPGAATFWQIKNLFELKAVIDAQVDSNVFEYAWRGSDVGYALWLKSVNQEGGCWFCGSRNIIVEKNIWRHIDGWLLLNGQESEHGPKPPPMTTVTLRNNLVYDSNATWSQGDNAYAMTASNNIVGLTIDHNTVVHTMTGLLILDGTDIQSPVITNNMFRRETYGIHSSTGEGTQALADYMPGYTFARNAVADAPSSSYPTNNTYESAAAWQAEFTAYSADGVGANYALAGGSALNDAGLDSLDIGADIAAITTATAGVTTGALTALTITPPTLPNAVRTVAYSQTLVASGGTAPYTWAITAGALPTSVTLNTSSGLISGTPTVSGSYTFTARATDNVAATASQAYTVIVRDPVSITTTSPLAGATQNSGYSRAIVYAGGEAPYSCTVTSGTLPAGLSLGSSTCTLTGTPTTLGISSFTIQVAGALGSSASRAFLLTVAREAMPTGRPVTSGPTPVQAAVFRGSSAPTSSIAGCCAIGDIWIDTSGVNPMMKTATSVSGSVTWTQATSGILLSGNGSGITNLNASQLTTGTIPPGVFPAALNISGAFSALSFGASTGAVTSYLEFGENACGSLAPSGKARLCADSSSHTLKASLNGGAYASLGAGGTTSGGASLANADSTVTFALSSTDASDSYSFGMSTGNGRKASLLSLQGTKFQAMQFGDATNDTDYVWAVGTSNDSGSTWTRWIGARHDGVVSTKNLTLDSQAAGTCNAANRGRIVYVAGGAGVKDIVQICAKDASDSYAFRTIY